MRPSQLVALAEHLSPESLVARTRGVIESQIDDEVVALNIETGTCYGLNSVGSRIWHLLETPVRIGQICKALSAEYCVEPDECMHDVVELISNLRAENLVMVIDDR